MCVYIYIYIHTYLYTYIYIYMLCIMGFGGSPVSSLPDRVLAVSAALYRICFHTLVCINTGLNLILTYNQGVANTDANNKY